MRPAAPRIRCYSILPCRHRSIVHALDATTQRVHFSARKKPANNPARFCQVAVLALCLLAFCGCRESSETRQIISRLRSSSVSVQLKGISEAEAHPNPKLRSELLRLFDEPREQPLVRGAAALSLGRLHDARLPARAVKRLPDAIVSSGKTGSLRTEAFILAKALTAYGPESLDAISTLLRDPRKEVVAWTIAHCCLYHRNNRALHVLAQYLNSPEALYRRSAAYGLAQIFHPDAEPLMLKRLADVDPEVRYHLAWGLSNYGTKQALAPAEAQLAREKEPQVRAELTRAMAEIRAREALVASQPQPLARAKTR